MAASFEALNIENELKKIPQTECNLVSGFIRESDAMKNVDTPEDIIKMCLLFTFRLLFKSSILSPDECEELQQMIGEHRNECASEWKLLYRGSRDGYKKKDCHSKCYSHPNVVLIVEILHKGTSLVDSLKLDGGRMHIRSIDQIQMHFCF